jgi:hypothetical protein
VALFLPPLEFLSHNHSQFLDVERLSHGLDYVALPFGEIHGLVDTRNHNGLDIRVNLLHSLQEFQSVDVGHFQIDGRKVDRIIREYSKSIGTINSLEHRVPFALKQTPECVAHRSFIVDHQNFGRRKPSLVVKPCVSCKNYPPSSPPVGRFGDTVCRVWDIHPPFREILLKILEGHPGILPANLRAVPQLTMRGGSDSLTVRRT